MPIAKPMLVLGLMSGTSADGIDVALAEISGAPPRTRLRMLAHAAFPFPAAVRREILRVAEQRPITAGALSQLNFRVGEVFADAALAACKQFKITPRNLALIGSHGQTIFHQGIPQAYLGSRTASTLQIGEGSVLATRTGVTTVSDLRTADIAAGGQAAPLVPFADYVLYRSPTHGRVSLNLGGIANITVLPVAVTPSQITAFDTGPANIVIDALVERFSKGRQQFDKNARMAASGRSLPALLDELLRDPYLKLAPPKSTGREYFGASYVAKLIAQGRRYHATPNDLIRAATIFSALSIVDALHRFVLPKHAIHQLIVSGGGAKNPLLLAQLAAALPKIAVLPSSDFGVSSEGKEATAFALMAYETFHQRPSNLPSATGARHPAILGKISYAPPR